MACSYKSCYFFSHFWPIIFWTRSSGCLLNRWMICMMKQVKDEISEAFGNNGSRIVVIRYLTQDHDSIHFHFPNNYTFGNVTIFMLLWLFKKQRRRILSIARPFLSYLFQVYCFKWGSRSYQPGVWGRVFSSGPTARPPQTSFGALPIKDQRKRKIRSQAPRKSMGHQIWWVLIKAFILCYFSSQY